MNENIYGGQMCQSVSLVGKGVVDRVTHGVSNCNGKYLLVIAN